MCYVSNSETILSRINRSAEQLFDNEGGKTNGDDTKHISNAWGAFHKYFWPGDCKTRRSFTSRMNAPDSTTAETNRVTWLKFELVVRSIESEKHANSMNVCKILQLFKGHH